MAELVGIYLSPWTERARWALDHHRIPYREVEYTPMISEPAARLKLKRLGGRITVPILFDDGAILRDSYDIARHADSRGTAPPLFPAGAEGEIAGWNRRSEPAMEAGRSLVVARTAASPEAALESVPGPAWAKPALRPVATLGVRYFQRKYALEGHTTESDLATLRTALLATREALAGGRDTILAGFSYADIIAATVVQFIEPLPPAYRRISDANRPCWTTPELVDEFPDLIEWRDRLYAGHRL